MCKMLLDYMHPFILQTISHSAMKMHAFPVEPPKTVRGSTPYFCIYVF